MEGFEGAIGAHWTIGAVVAMGSKGSIGSEGAMGAEGAEGTEWAEGVEGAEEDEWAAIYILLGKVRTLLEWPVELLSKMCEWVSGWVIPLRLLRLLEHLRC